jgi:hypothetical protein
VFRRSRHAAVRYRSAKPSCDRGLIRVISGRTVRNGAAVAASGTLTHLCRTLAISAAAPSNPDPPLRALRFDEFSERPTKSRIAGSANQARRSAARVSSTGTPAARNARMSEPASIASIGGNPQVLETLSADFNAPGAHPAQADPEISSAIAAAVDCAKRMMITPCSEARPLIWAGNVLDDDNVAELSC